MIEVEKKFTPDDEELAHFLEGAESLGEKIIHDVYYDYPDFRLLKKDIRLRNRNGSFELKIGKSSGVSEELENEKEIASYFDISKNFELFIRENLVPIMEFVNKRKKYVKEGFNIDVDDMDFGYKMCEIEIMVNDEKEIKEAQEKIMKFVSKFGFENKKALSKRQAYFKLLKPDVYKELYGDK